MGLTEKKKTDKKIDPTTFSEGEKLDWWLTENKIKVPEFSQYLEVKPITVYTWIWGSRSPKKDTNDLIKEITQDLVDFERRPNKRPPGRPRKNSIIN